MEELNRSLFLMINASAHPSSWMLFMATVLAEWVIYGVPLLLAGLWLWGGRGNRVAALAGVLSIAFALGCSQLVSMHWPHPRPFMIGLGHAFLAHTPEASFPSDHATVFFTLGLVLMWASLRKASALVLLLGIVVGWARVYLGVHFPLDLVGALWVAAVSSCVVVLLLSNGQLRSRLLDCLESLYRCLFAFLIAKGWIRP
ncbi:undecaprenyl-diphosphatase [Metapseudomonas resinovorans]|uniref:phosphatase PAP2 family protein n=1 Tax=Metapseudomonas resinovorans TaxID=53412 RepID=UPI000985018F|nr:phosphatase PAP2 family protein [Pseudomonas resinovorans]GLZ89557.1 undecaprenyl-diphosphatase [Pseudomonas resinovorans]